MRLEINGKNLSRLFAAFSLPEPGAEIVVFALRGCVPAKAMKGWSSSVILKSAPVDHEHLRCTLGLLDRKTGRVFVALGSTVPHRDNVLKAAARKGAMKGRGTNQMEPGYYADLTKGEHLQGKPMGHAALRQTGYRFYRRSHHAPPYTTRDPLYFSNPYDNLHCAWNLDGNGPGFRSSGCMVVAGWPHCPRLPDSGPNEGAWKTFHDLVYAAPHKKFPLLLLTAAQTADALRKKKTSSLCYGSTGERVKELQQTLKRKKFYAGRVDGKLGAATYRAWNRSGFIAS